MFPLCPFTACAEFLPPGVFDKSRTVAEVMADWDKFHDGIAFVNYGILMRYAHFMFANLDGQPPDGGVIAELSLFSSNYGPVIGERSDFRLDENMAAPINPAVIPFMGKMYPGKFFVGPDAFDQSLIEVKNMTTNIVKDTQK